MAQLKQWVISKQHEKKHVRIVQQKDQLTSQKYQICISFHMTLIQQVKELDM